MNNNQPADLKNRNEKIFVLVHGAGQGAWAFGKVAWPLARHGHHMIARDLPGHGLRARYPQSCLERPADPDRFATEPSPLAQLSAHDFAGELTATIRQLAERMPGRQIVLTRRTIQRGPSGRFPARLIRCVISATALSSSMLPSWAMPGFHAEAGSCRIACSSAA
jgi:pimeloyl-ACP methyl ester carboxylesterase